jgi:peptidoglycan hydrolase-like protein with peptidoglycan-binding domain
VKPWPGKLLKLTSPLTHNADVKWVQQHLNSHGAKLSVDSQFGPKTRDAVKAFQRAKKLEVDGIVGAKTWTALGKS